MHPAVEKATTQPYSVLGSMQIIGLRFKCLGSPSLKKELHPCALALIPDGSHPIGMKGPRSGAGFAAEDNGVDR